MTLWIVAAPGPSLTPEVAALCRGNVLAVNDAYRRLPDATAMYAADREFWNVRKGCPDFRGDKWTVRIREIRNKRGRKVYPEYQNAEVISRYGLNVIEARPLREGFCFDPGFIHLGKNSGFQAVNLAIEFGGNPIIMVGFDMHGTHFFGPHVYPLRQRGNFQYWIPEFEKAAKALPPGLRIINATLGSALTCFPIMTLQEALDERRDVRP